MENNFSDRTGKTHSRKQLVLSLVFGIPSMMFSVSCATFVTIMSLFGLSVALSDKGLLPMTVCLFLAYANAFFSVMFAVISQKAGMISALNKVSLALSISSSCAATLIYITLALALLLSKTGFLIH